MVYGIQVLRALAALLVVARHSAKIATNSEAAFAIGQCGVDIFFVISGVVIYLTGRDLDWHVFLRRRIARIVPLYWLMTLLVIPADIARHQAGGPYWLPNMLLSFFFIPSRAPSGSIFPPVFVGWTLNFEMAFYFVCVLVLLFAPKPLFHRAVSAAILIAVLIGLPLLAAGDWIATPATFLLLPISIEFVAGLWLAHFWTKGVRLSPLLSGLLIAAAMVWLAVAPIAAQTTVWRPAAWGVPAAAIVWAALCLEERIGFSRWKIPLALGAASYALYLVHPFALWLLDKAAKRVMPGLPMPLEFILLLVGATVAGLALHYLVELRLLQLANRLLGLHRRANRAMAQSDPALQPAFERKD